MTGDQAILGRLFTAVLAAAGVLVLAGLAPRPDPGGPAAGGAEPGGHGGVVSTGPAAATESTPGQGPRESTGAPDPDAPGAKGTPRAESPPPAARGSRAGGDDHGRDTAPTSAPSRGELTIERKAGESLEELCRRVYGSRGMASLTRRAGWLVEGERGIRVPVARRARVGRGDTLSRLAARHCGSPSRWPVLAALSGIDDPKQCAPGTELVLPAVMRIRVRGGDTLSSLASEAWGEAEGATLLAKWNRLRTGAPLVEGSWIEIPLAGPFLDPNRAGD